MLGLKDAGDIDTLEFSVSNSCNSGVEFLVRGEFVDNFEAVFVFHCGWICPGVEDGDVEVVFLEGFDDVDDLGVAYVGAVLLESEAKDNDVAAEYLYSFFKHEFDDAVGYVCTHAVVHAPSGENDFGVVAISLGALREIVGVDAYAVAAYESRLERKEVPFC